MLPQLGHASRHKGASALALRQDVVVFLPKIANVGVWVDVRTIVLVILSTPWVVQPVVGLDTRWHLELNVLRKHAWVDVVWIVQGT